MIPKGNDLFDERHKITLPIVRSDLDPQEKRG